MPDEKSLMIFLEDGLLETPYQTLFALIKSLEYDTKMTLRTLYAVGYKSKHNEQPELPEMYENMMIYSLAVAFYQKMVR
jgi:hypothetical protein